MDGQSGGSSFIILIIFTPLDKNAFLHPGSNDNAEERAADNRNVLSLYAPTACLIINTSLREGSHWGVPHSDSADVDDESTVVQNSDANKIIISVLSTAKVFDL